MKDPIVSSHWLKEELNNPNLVILDASQPTNIGGITSDFDSLQIKGARFFDLKNSFSDKNSPYPNMLPSEEQFQAESRKLGINSDSIIVVYDNLGVYTSPRVWWMFKTMGHDAVFVLDGGLPQWSQDGYETEEKIDHPSLDGNFKARIRPEMVKDFQFVKANIVDNNALVIDARSSGRFNGTAPEPRKDLRSGSIPNSVNIPYEEVLEEGKYKSKKALQKLFQERNINDQPLVFSCGSGITACIVLLASELIQENKKSVYDGSWTEWAQLEN
ncbi:sulfurtransferase [Arenibacter sp. 6A1]|uniref:sulfurtransferase n=1 Tax=Arenibacter sp. 6A1 TaxID=2720391 RepID=UPI00144791AC|nr:rhodanese-like domain-containing protein [Arenibacter sp. 6A1]NKI27323.1 sulfurtransferase [Arenibacter sp. 6A1]